MLPEDLFFAPLELGLLAVDLALVFFVVDERPLEPDDLFALVREDDEPLFARLLLDEDDDRAFVVPVRPLSFERDDEFRDEVRDGDIVSAAAPTAPTAAPAAAPVKISPATSMTLSTNLDVVDFRDPVDLRVDEELLFLVLLERDVLAIFPPLIRK